MNDFSVELRTAIERLRTSALYRLAVIQRWDIALDEMRELVAQHADEQVVAMLKKRPRLPAGFGRDEQRPAAAAERERPRETLVTRLMGRFFGRR